MLFRLEQLEMENENLKQEMKTICKKSSACERENDKLEKEIKLKKLSMFSM